MEHWSRLYPKGATPGRLMEGCCRFANGAVACRHRGWAGRGIEVVEIRPGAE